MHTSSHTHTYWGKALSSVCFWTRRLHCSFHLPTPLSACCWHHYVNTNTVFLSSSPGRGVPLIFLFLLRAFGNSDGGMKGSGTWVNCGKPECSLWPHSMQPSPSPPLFLYLCFSFGRESYEASCRSHIVASNDLGKHALLMLCAHLNPVQL